MIFYPSANFNIVSPLKADEAEARLFNFVTPQSKYDGLILNRQFKIEARSVNLKRPMLGIKGYVSAAGKGSEVVVKVQPTGPGMIGIFVYLLFELMLVYTAIWGGGIGNNFFWMPLGVGFLGYLLFVILLKYETGIYKKVMLKILNGKLASKND